MVFDSATTKSARDGVPAVYPLLNKDIAMIRHPRRIGSTGVLLVCLDISKVLAAPSLLWPPISEQGSAAIPSYLTRGLSRELLDTYWIPGTRESFFALTYPKAWNAL